MPEKFPFLISRAIIYVCISENLRKITKFFKQWNEKLNRKQ